MKGMTSTSTCTRHRRRARGFDEAPNVALRRLLGLESTGTEGDGPPTDGLADRARGLMVGIAVDNLLGRPYEGRRWNHVAIAAEFPDGIHEIASQAGLARRRPYQSILLAEASIAVDVYDIDDLAYRFWAWAELNGTGMGPSPAMRCGCSAVPSHGANSTSAPFTEPLRPAVRHGHREVAQQSMRLAWLGRNSTRRLRTARQCVVRQSRCAGWRTRRWSATAWSAPPLPQFSQSEICAPTAFTYTVICGLWATRSNTRSRRWLG